MQNIALRAYQADNKSVAAQFIQKDVGSTTYGFQVASFDLIIDPLLLVFSTFLSGSKFQLHFASHVE
ncbi:MAG: hypothetical protein ACFFCZ_24905 [Promethearchaeota archaeon]